MGKKAAPKKVQEPEVVPKPAPKGKGKAKAKGKSKSKPPMLEGALSWDQLEDICVMYELTEKEGRAALEEILGPEPKPEACKSKTLSTSASPLKCPNLHSGAILVAGIVEGGLGSEACACTGRGAGHQENQGQD